VAWLSAHPRCSLCGSLLEIEDPERCPTCRSSIAAVGQRTDYDQWRTTRQRGRWRFVWVSHVLAIGLPMAIASTAVKWYVRARPPGLEDVVVSACWIALAYVIATFKWHGSEREFLEHEAAQEPSSTVLAETEETVHGDQLSAPR